MKRDNENTFVFDEVKYDEALKKQAHFMFIGFAIFDIVHILIGIYFFIFILLNERANLLGIAEAALEVVVSITLIAFVKAIGDKQNNSATNRLYIYAWLLASVSLLVPSLCGAISYFHRDITPSLYVDIVILVFEGVMYSFFFVSLFLSNHQTIWKILLYLGMFAFGLSGILENVNLFVESAFSNQGHELINTYLEFIKNLVTVVPAVFGLIGFYRVDKLQNGRLL